MRFTVSDLKNSRVPAALGVCNTDPRVIAWLNEATERLLYSGKWWGTVSRFVMCASDGCITLPPTIATIEAINVCGQPVPVRDFWYEFLENGWGSVTSGNPGCCNSNQSASPLVGGSGCMAAAIMRGNYPTFADIRGTNKKLNFICDLSNDVGKTVLALGYDQNANWIRTLQGGVYKDGELITLAQGSGTISTNFFSSVTGIQLPSGMSGQTWLYEYDNDLTTKRMIGHYQYYETNPSYGRYFFPGVIPPSSTSGGCGFVKMEVAGKLAYIPVSQDTDYLIIGCIPALKEMMKAIKRAENEQDSEAANDIVIKGQKTAEGLLDVQLDHFFGSGRKMGMNVTSTATQMADPIPTLQ